jgi:hypothetical protein
LTFQVVRQRCREDGTFLASVVAGYVGEAQLAQDAVLERCKTDPEHLDAVVDHYLSSRSGAARVEMLRSCLGPSAVAERLGFDPFDPDRDTAYRLSRRLFNSPAQIGVLVLGLVVFALICLFPPWLRQNWQTVWLLIIPTRQIVSSEFAGFHFAFARMPETDSTTYAVDVWLLLFEWLLWFFVIVGLCMVLRDRRTVEQRLARLAKRREGRQGP